LAQIMNGNPLFGLPGLPSPLINQPMVPKTNSTPCESDEDDKSKLHDVINQPKQPSLNGLQYQNAALQRNLIARVQAQAQMHPSAANIHPQARLKSPKINGRNSPENPLKRSPDDPLCGTPDMKRSRQSPLSPSNVAALHPNSQLEGALANLAVFMPAQNTGQMMNSRRDCLSSLRNLAFQLFTGLSAVLAQMERGGAETPVDPIDASVKIPTEPPRDVSPIPVPQTAPIASIDANQLHIPQINIPAENSTPKPESPNVTEDVEEIEQMDDSENSKVSDLVEEQDH
jgi:hypothetical protein